MEHCSYQIRLVPLLGSSQKGSLMSVRLACPLLRNDFLVLIEILVEANGFCFTRSFFFVRFSYLLGCKCHSYSILAYPNFCNDPLYFSTPTPPCLWLGVFQLLFVFGLCFFAIADSRYLLCFGSGGLVVHFSSPGHLS